MQNNIYHDIPFFYQNTPEWQGWNRRLIAASCGDQAAQDQIDTQPIYWLVEADNGTGYMEAVSPASLVPLAVEPGTRLMKAQYGVIAD